MARFIWSLVITPIGTKDTSLSKFVAAALRALKEKGIKFELTPMATILKANSLDEIFSAVKVAHEAVLKMGVKRVVISINIDDRLDKIERKAQDKVESVMEKLK